MTSLEEFTPYTSYRLHWFPYEITRCTEAHQDTVSTHSVRQLQAAAPLPRLQPAILRSPDSIPATWTHAAGRDSHLLDERLRPSGRARGL